MARGLQRAAGTNRRSLQISEFVRWSGESERADPGIIAALFDMVNYCIERRGAIILHATRTQPGQEKESMQILDDET